MSEPPELLGCIREPLPLARRGEHRELNCEEGKNRSGFKGKGVGPGGKDQEVSEKSSTVRRMED